MKLTEAMASGRRFRRPHWTGRWYQRAASGNYWAKNEWPEFSPDDLLATDYETEEFKLVVTRSSLWAAWQAASFDSRGFEALCLALGIGQ